MGLLFSYIPKKYKYLVYDVRITSQLPILPNFAIFSEIYSPKLTKFSTFFFVCLFFVCFLFCFVLFLFVCLFVYFLFCFLFFICLFLLFLLIKGSDVSNIH